MPFIGSTFRVINVLRAIQDLESNGAREEACRLRQLALASTPTNKAAPLWRSEGHELLYHKKDYHGALLAFEKAMQVMEDSPTLCGVTRPDLVYAGAAQAALLAGKRETAKRYMELLSRLVADFEIRIKDPRKLEWHKQVLNWLQTKLDELPSADLDG